MLLHLLLRLVAKLGSARIMLAVDCSWVIWTLLLRKVRWTRPVLRLVAATVTCFKQDSHLRATGEYFGVLNFFKSIIIILTLFMSIRALVLATQSKEDSAAKRHDPSKLTSGPKSQINYGGLVNADGTPRKQNQSAVDARKLVRISGINHFLLLEDEKVAGHLTLSVIQVSCISKSLACSIP